MKTSFAVALVAVIALTACSRPKGTELLNISYDPTREFYTDFNAAFIRHWEVQTGETIVIKQSHGGSGKQARAVIDGQRADVVTLALAADIDAIASIGHLLPADWQKRLPHNSAPYTSTIVFLVRRTNPKHIKDWDDLVKPGVQVITPNPQTSGGARWNYLAAWGYALKKYGSEEKAQAFVAELFKHVPVLDSGARGATTTFVQREIGDVEIAWENEAFLALKEFGRDKFQIVNPSISILAEPTVAWVDANTERNGTTDVAKAYLEYLYSDEGQEIAGRNFYRPTNPRIAAKYEVSFPKLQLFSVDEVFGGWTKAQQTHFAAGGVFERIYTKK